MFNKIWIKIVKNLTDSGNALKKMNAIFRKMQNND